MIHFRIARRYLWAARKEAHTAFLSLISMLGLAVGVATLLISLALLSGLQGQIKQRLIASSPQLLIEPAGKNTIENAPVIAEAGTKLGMRDVRMLVSGIAWGANQNERRGRPMRLQSALQPVPADRIHLSRDSAAALGLTTGDFITIVAPRTRLTPFGPVPIMKRYRVGQILPPASDDRAPE